MQQTTSTITPGYWATSTILERYGISKRTLLRWMDKEVLPFPKPKIQPTARTNRWAIDDVIAWEHQSQSFG